MYLLITLKSPLTFNDLIELFQGLSIAFSRSKPCSLEDGAFRIDLANEEEVAVVQIHHLKDYLEQEPSIQQVEVVLNGTHEGENHA